jgi:hypothetical protein
MEFTTPQQHNEYLVGRLLTIACKARPSLESHFRKFMNRPDLLLPMMCDSLAQTDQSLAEERRSLGHHERDDSLRTSI